jgi:CheY-like chemotaxis protein
MDAATLARATEPFFSTKPEGAGTGLGLTSVSAFAANAHGYMMIASVLGEGTSVSLHIPRTLTERATTREADAAMPMGDGELVLVVDDDNAVRESTLQRVEALGYSVEAAAHAGEAISKILSMPSIALVLSDIAMPGDLNGFGLRDWVAVEMPHVPVVLISAHEHFLSDGGADTRGGRLLAKSCSRRQLAQALNCARASKAQGQEGQSGWADTGTAST